MYSDTVETEEKTKRAWELGIGVSVFQFSRVDFTNFQKLEDKYKMDLQLRHNVIGGNLYVARELNRHFYLDVQGTVGITEQWVDGKDRIKTLFMVGPGLQWRFGEYFGSEYIEPYARVGVSYMKKNFDMNYTGVEGDLPEEMEWVLENMKTSAISPGVRPWGPASTRRRKTDRRVGWPRAARAVVALFSSIFLEYSN